MKTLLITGVNGFTGRYFIDYIRSLNSDIKIVGIDSKEKGSGKNDNFRFIKCNLLNKRRIDSIIGRVYPDYIFHFAGLNFSRDYRELLNHNVFSTKSLLDAVTNTRCKPRVLIIGSAAEYGPVSQKEQPVSESTPLRPVTAYGVSKAVQNLLALQYYSEFGLSIVIARTFNIIGPGQTTRLVCGSIVKQIKDICLNKAKTNKLIIGNLHTKRDFIDIRDVVRAYWKLMMCKKTISGEIFNIGSGKSHSIRDIIDILFRHCGREIAIEQKTERIRKKDIPVQIADIKKIRNMVGWKPLISIESSLREMYASIK